MCCLPRFWSGIDRVSRSRATRSFVLRRANTPRRDCAKMPEGARRRCQWCQRSQEASHPPSRSRRRAPVHVMLMPCMLVTVPCDSLRTGGTLAVFRASEGQLGRLRCGYGATELGCARLPSGNHGDCAGGARGRSERAPLMPPLAALVLRVLREAHFLVHGRPVEAVVWCFCVAGVSLVPVCCVGAARLHGD